MKFTGTTYRPPIEADSLLLQVTVGCAHNKCTYCPMYRDVSFGTENLEQIEKDLIEARQYHRHVERIFLVNGDAFVLSARRLKEIALKIKHYFPECNTITMYSSIQNIKSKTDDELKELRALGINDLYLGIESGSDEVLKRINKGHTIQEAKEQLKRLDNANINHIASLMLGVAGKGKGLENARATATFLNETNPSIIWLGTLGVVPGTELFEEVQEGQFEEASEIENLMEEKLLLESIEVHNVPFYGVHVTNSVPLLGLLPRDREQLIRTVSDAIDNFDEEEFKRTFDRVNRGR